MKPFLRTLALSVLVLAAACKKEESPVVKVQGSPGTLQLPHGRVEKVEITWTPTKAIEAEAPTVFVHLLDSDKKVVRTFDHPFPQAWTVGTPVSYDIKVFQSALAPPLAAGKYLLAMGLYYKDGKRWALEGLPAAGGRDEYQLAEVTVPAKASGPTFALAPTWSPLEEGGDRQVVARRWMLNRGAIRLVDQSEPGTVWMVVHIPEEKTAGYTMVYDKDATTPVAKAIGSCGGTEMSVSGPGQHEIELAVEAPPADGFCRILLTANFALKPTTPAGTSRSISLDNLAWIPGAPGPETPAGDDKDEAPEKQ